MNQDHTSICVVCGQSYDMRRLEEVVEHMHLDKEIKVTYSSSKKVGDTVEHPENKNIDPLNLN